MSAEFRGAFSAQTIVVPDRLETVLQDTVFDQPTLVIDLQRLRDRYDALSQSLTGARIHYAVKANPVPEVIRTLVEKGSRFDAASRAEIALCLQQGAKAGDISFGNTIKSPSDIAFAHAVGVSLFAADAAEELQKIAQNAPGARVYIRVLVTCSQADWPLSRKFGCPADRVVATMEYAKSLGLNPVGLSFHVGSQTRQSAFWFPILKHMAQIWHEARAAGYELTVLNIGGGFPASYDTAVEDTLAYGVSVMSAVKAWFGQVPYVMAEPGRGLVAEIGHIAAQVMLVARKSADDLHRWVYLDIGKFSGLAETMDEAIRYRISTSKDGAEMGPCVLAGPTCDSADVLYETRPVLLPVTLAAGDRVIIRNCGAYTTTYASVGFNGFPPLAVRVL